MQSKILSSILCSSLLASALFADNNATSNANEPNFADGGGALTHSFSNSADKIITYELGAVEITAPQSVDYNPSVSTINSKSIKDTGSDNIAQAIRFSSGTLFNEATARRGEPAINIRGYDGTKIGLFLDGIPMMSIYDKQTDFGQYITQGIANIQISKGFASPVYGMNTLGGAINLVSARPEKELELSLHQRLLFGRHSSPDEVRQGISVGTNQGLYYFQADISHTDRSTYPLSSDFKATAIQPKGDKINAYYNNKTAKLKFGIQPNENHEYSLNYIYQRGSKGGLYSDDGGGPWWDWTNYDKNTLYLLGNSYFTPDLSLNTRLYYDNFYNRLVSDATKCLNGDGTLNTARYCNSGSIYDDDTFGAILTLGYDIYEDANVKFGVNEKRDTHREKDANTKDLNQNLQELSTSVFAQYAQRLGAFRFVLAGSYDRADPIIIDFLDGQGNIKDKQAKLDGFSVQGILYFDISEGQSTHFSVGKKENLPTLKQRYTSIWGSFVPNSDLGIENALNYELGYNLNLVSTTLSVAVYYNDMRNMFVQKTLASGANEATVKAAGGCETPTQSRGTYYCYQNVNAKSGYTYGGEVSVEQGLFENDMLILGANYSYIQRVAKNVGLDEYKGADGKKILNYPNHIFNAKIAVKPLEKLEFIGLGTLQSARYYADGNGGYDKGANYFTLDISASYELVQGLSVSAGVLNITDRDNYAGVAGVESFHFAGRQWFAGFDYKY